MLIANYRGLRKNDEVALELAQRWSKVAAVLFAVGAVTGTVLSFEFGLLWPEFTGRFGEVFGILFTIEGIFFFLEAIFLTIYIFGWKRLSGWTHFWTGIPVAICGIGGAYSVVAVNAWMNQPAGTPWTRRARSPTSIQWGSSSTTRRLLRGAAHDPRGLHGDLLPGRLGLRGGDAPRAPRPAPPARPPDPADGRLILAPIQFAVGDTAARAIAEDQPVKFASMECVKETSTDVTEYLGGLCTIDGVKGAIGIPGLDSFLVGFSTDTEGHRLRHGPAGDRQPKAKTMLHLAFDFMVGVGSALIALGVWFGIVWWRKRDIPQTKWFLRAVAVSGVLTVLAMEAGWIVTEVGRQPWIVYEVMKTEDAVTDAGGLWYFFGARGPLRGARHRDDPDPPLDGPALARGRVARGGTSDIPNGPEAARPRGERFVSTPDAVAGVLWVGVTLYAVFGGADFGAGFWALLTGRDGGGGAPAH